jgi:hypothetical protein
MKSLKDVSHEKLIDLYSAAVALKNLHSKKGGLEQHRKHAEIQKERYLKEMLERMNFAPKALDPL